jgi:uncharacterized protein involved in exopolysaccharide biosynthesis
MEDDYQPVAMGNFRDILTIFFKHKTKIIITFLVIAIGVTLFALRLPKTYEAKSVLLVKFGREFLSRPEAGSGTDRSALSIRPETIIRGELSVLTSRDLSSKVVSALGPENIYPGLAKNAGTERLGMEAALRSFEESLSVTVAPGSSLIQVAFTHKDPVVAAKAVNMLVDLFKEKHLEVFSTTSTSFLEAQLGTYGKRLKESESNLATFKRKHGVISFDEQKSALLAQRSALDVNLRTTQNQISELEHKIAFIKSPQWSTDTQPEARTQLLALQQREQELLQKYAESSRMVQNIRKEMQVVRDVAQGNSENIRNVEISKTMGELTVLRAKADGLRRDLGHIDGEVRTLDAQGNELQNIKRDAAQQERNYQTYTQKLEESLILDDMDRQKMVAISVIEKATDTMTPKKSRFSKKILILMGLIGGGFAGLALAFLLEFLSPGMTTPFSAERRLSLPVMVAIPRRT